MNKLKHLMRQPKCDSQTTKATSKAELENMLKVDVTKVT